MHKVTFITNCDTYLEPIFVEDCKKAPEPQELQRDGYTFAGWYVGKTEWVFIGYVVTEDMTIEAMWTPNTNTLSFDGNGATSGAMSSVTGITDSIIELPNNAFIRNGYDFLGWSTTKDGEVEIENGAEYQMGTKNATLYAVWQEQETVTYTVIIVDKNTGKPISGVNVYIQAEKDEYATVYGRGKTDENGVFTASVEPSKAKYVSIENVPAGYVFDDFYDMGETGVEIKIGTEIIKDHGGFGSVSLELGSVMCDFTLNTLVYNKETGEVENGTVTLSELFASGKKAVMLNFWFTTCTYCIEEFPYIQKAYEKYGDEIEIIGINAYPTDRESAVIQFLKYFAEDGYYTDDGCALTFPMAIDTLGIQSAFGITANPTTVIIDRYGVVSMFQVGAVVSERYFINAFRHYTADNYEQALYSSIYDLSLIAKPDVEMSGESEIKDAVVNGDINISFKPETEGGDAEYAWPFIVYEKDGEMCLASTNMELDNSYCILYATVELKAGQAIMFDYFASTERYNDVLYIFVDGKEIYTISGVMDDWQTYCPWVATEDGKYEVAFCYFKDESDLEGEDRVYLDNFRVVEKEEITAPTYIPRYAATNRINGVQFANYIDIFLNERDGYYHVGSENGPILLANLMGYTQFSNESVCTCVVENGEFIIDGADVYDSFMNYCSYAANSRIYGYCPVTEELRGYLEAFVMRFGYESDENTWLQLCSYYDAYGTDGQLEDPIKGLATFSAFDVVVTPEGSEGFLNTVTYQQVIMPRGYLYKFVPTKSGVYRITSNADQEVDGWVFTGSLEQWINENNGNRILFTDSSVSERYCLELLVDKDGDGHYEKDTENVSMIAYFEAGETYYIDIAYYDVYAMGTFTFDVKYVSESLDVFVEASPGPFTFDEYSGDIIAGGINVALCDDDSDPRYGYYCHLLEDGSLGSIVYVDFVLPTYIFNTASLTQLIENDAFNMFMTETDRTAYVYRVNYYDKGGIEALENLWGADFEEFWETYQMEDVINGVYHGAGPDYTDAMRAYLNKLEDGTDGVSDDIIYPERQGCVAVDENLAVMLQALMDKFTFEGIENSWTKLCYYYLTLSE